MRKILFTLIVGLSCLGAACTLSDNGISSSQNAGVNFRLSVVSSQTRSIEIQRFHVSRLEIQINGPVTQSLVWYSGYSTNFDLRLPVSTYSLSVTHIGYDSNGMEVRATDNSSFTLEPDYITAIRIVPGAIAATTILEPVQTNGYASSYSSYQSSSYPNYYTNYPTSSYQYSSSSVPADAYEPDNDLAHVTILPSDGTIQYHTIHNGGDTDSIAVYLDSNRLYAIETLQSGYASMDTYLTLFNSNGSPLSYDDDSGSGLFSLICYTPAESGTYYIQARGYSSYSLGSYGIRVSETNLPVYTNSYTNYYPYNPATNVMTPDSYEYDNELSNATPISADGTVYLHNLQSETDIDVMYFHAAAGATYTAHLNSTNVGPITLLVGSTNGGLFGTATVTNDFVFTVTNSETLYLVGCSYGYYTTGWYSASLTASTPASSAAPRRLSAPLNPVKPVNPGEGFSLIDLKKAADR